jgi:hypothetical protein
LVVWWVCIVEWWAFVMDEVDGGLDVCQKRKEVA